MAPGRRERDAAGGDIEHTAVRGEVHGLAELYADYLQGRADYGVIARCSGLLLPRLDDVQIGFWFTIDEC
ncbi:MAG: hypothetical protein Q8N51_02205 [Gammaproteobacteria bacterium]|nr:hypothetical protein [Gammaproteobacteria bacterium]